MDRRIILNEINAAFDAQAALQAQQSGGQPVEAELAAMIGQLFTGLRQSLALMTEINDVWQANGMTARIANAAQTGAALAGYSPADWATWGAITPRVMEFLGAEYSAQMPDGTTVTETPRTVLLRRYTQEA